MTVVVGMSDVEYHARPELSSTGARQILESPARFRYWADNRRPDTADFDLGHAVHTKVLGTGMRTVAIPDDTLSSTGGTNTKAARAFIEAARSAGQTPVKSGVLSTLNAMAEAVLAHTTARAILDRAGGREVSVFATDPDTGVECRARFDILGDDIAADLKTTAGSASRIGFGREAARFGYPIQEAHYTDTLAWATGAEPRFMFLVVEKDAPHLVAVHEFDEVTRMVGSELALKARQTFAECVATDTWPGYGDDVLTTEIPVWWFIHAEAEQEEMTF